MSVPSAEAGAGDITTRVAQDVHIGGEHGWVEWVRVVADERCVVGTPLSGTALENWRPIFEVSFLAAMLVATVACVAVTLVRAALD